MVTPVAKYHPISPNIWNRDFRNVGQKSLEALVVYLYLITCRPRGTEGLFSLHKGYISADTGLEADAVEKALDVLIEAGYISYDIENDVILDRHALRYYSPGAGFQTKGALNRIEQVPDSPLKEDLLELALSLAPDFAENVINRFPSLKGSSRSPKGSLDTASRARARAEHREEKEHQPRREESEKSPRVSGSDSQEGSKIISPSLSENGWTWGEERGECSVCGRPCTSRDPEDGAVRHPACSERARATPAEGGF